LTVRGRRLAFLAPWLLAALAPPAWAAAPQPPLSVSVVLLSADADRGRYRVELRLRSDVALEDAAITVRLLPRGAGAAAARAGRAPRESREGVALAPGRELRRELEVLTDAQEEVTLLVGLGGRAGGARLHRTRGLDLGPPSAPEPAATVRTDQEGRSYYEIRMPERRR
jgi:hypothetical protein